MNEKRILTVASITARRASVTTMIGLAVSAAALTALKQTGK
ncbi:MAG: hypothetical protein AAGF33_14625 [Pseudomonadota bacterium]